MRKRSTPSSPICGRWRKSEGLGDKMTRKAFVVTLVFAFVSLPLLAGGGGGPDPAPIYKAKCAMCHGPDGKGETPTGKKMKVRDLGSPEVQKMTDAELAKVIADGKNK